MTATDRLHGSGRVLIVTNDFPPRRGGIETFIGSLARGLPPDRVVVHTSSMPGDRDTDATLPFPVVRDPTTTLVPSPTVRRRILDTFGAHGCDRVVFGAAMSLGLLAPALRAAGAVRMVGVTHGHEVWWARVPAGRRLLRQVGDACDALTYIAGYNRDAIARALSPTAAAAMVRMPPAVDAASFRPGVGGSAVRARFGLEPDAPVAGCIARLARRKGQDTLIDAWPSVLERVPRARLLVAGPGDARRLRARARATGVGDAVVVTGGVAHAETPAYFAALDAFAMPCRDRLGGLEVEGLGIVFLEAQASGLPVVVGRSGGALDTVRPGRTGLVVDPTDVDEVADAVAGLLADPARSAGMGRAGREWVERDWTWARVHETLRGLLELPAPERDAQPVGR